MNGSRKIRIVAMGLVAELVLAGMSAWGGLSDSGLDTLAWACFALAASGIGGNAMEHFSKRPAAATTNVAIAT